MDTLGLLLLRPAASSPGVCIVAKVLDSVALSSFFNASEEGTMSIGRRPCLFLHWTFAGAMLIKLANKPKLHPNLTAAPDSEGKYKYCHQSQLLEATRDRLQQ